MNRSKGRHTIFLRFLMSYFLILIIPLCTGSLLYYRSTQLVEEDAREVNLSILDQSKDIIDGRLSEIDNTITQLALNSKIKSLLLLKEPIEDHIYQVRDVWRDLSSYTISNNFVSMFFIYFKDSDIILSPYTTYIRLPLFYGGIFQYNDMEYEQFSQEILNHYHHRNFMPSVPVTIDGKTKDMVLSIHSIPIEYPTEYSGNILFFINEEEIHKLMARLQTENGGWAYIADGNGEVITSYSRSNYDINPIILDKEEGQGFLERTISGERMIISYTTSLYNGWTYVAGIPYAVVMARVQYIKQLTWLTLIVSLIIGALIAYFLAYTNSKPLKDIILSLSEFYHKESRSDYVLIKGSISKLIDNNKEMQQAMCDQIPLLRAGFFDRLYRSEFNNEMEMKAVLAQTGWTIHDNQFVVLFIQINGYSGLVTKEVIEELNIKRILIREILMGVLNGEDYLHNIDIDKVTVLLCLNTKSNNINIKYTEELMAKAKAVLDNKYNISITISSSSIHNNLQNACYGFDEAKQALTYQMSDGKCNIIWYKNMITDSSIHHYPIDIVLKLMNLVKAGDKETVERIYKALYVENFMKRNLSPEMTWQLLYEIRGTLIKLIDEIYIEDNQVRNEIKCKTMQLYNGIVLEEVYPNVLEIFLFLCDTVNERKKSHNIQLKEKLICYIEEYYMDSALCLNFLASHFDVTEFYLSQFFKEQTGENFGSYLERIRINEAYKLLCKTDYAIDEIARKVGYNSAHTFRRAFKRVHGVVPTACRDATK